MSREDRVSHRAQAFRAPLEVGIVSEADGTVQKYVEMSPEDFSVNGGKRRLMLALHGYGSNRWQFINDSRDECRAARDVAVEYGMVFVSPDYRATASWMGSEAEADIMQIIKEMREDYPIDKVILVGASMGGTAALTFAARHPDIVGGVVSMNGTDADGEGNPASDTGFHAHRLTMPVALLVGADDKAARPDSIIRLAGILEKAGRQPFLICREGTGHETSYQDAVAAIRKVVSMVED